MFCCDVLETRSVRSSHPNKVRNQRCSITEGSIIVFEDNKHHFVYNLIASLTQKKQITVLQYVSLYFTSRLREIDF